MRRRSIYSINFEYYENTEDDYEGEGETKAKYFFFIIEGINTITERVSLTGRKDGKIPFCGTNNKIVKILLLTLTLTYPKSVSV